MRYQLSVYKVLVYVMFPVTDPSLAIKEPPFDIVTLPEIVPVPFNVSSPPFAIVTSPLISELLFRVN